MGILRSPLNPARVLAAGNPGERSRAARVDGGSLVRRRAGIEGTLSRGVHPAGLRQSRYRGIQKTHPRNVAIAAALSVIRTLDFLGHKPQALSQPSRFARLQA